MDKGILTDQTTIDLADNCHGFFRQITNWSKLMEQRPNLIVNEWNLLSMTFSRSSPDLSIEAAVAMKHQRNK
jgi:hypothetical protein